MRAPQNGERTRISKGSRDSKHNNSDWVNENSKTGRQESRDRRSDVQIGSYDKTETLGKSKLSETGVKVRDQGKSQMEEEDPDTNHRPNSTTEDLTTTGDEAIVMIEGQHSITAPMQIGEVQLEVVTDTEIEESGPKDYRGKDLEKGNSEGFKENGGKDQLEEDNISKVEVEKGVFGPQESITLGPNYLIKNKENTKPKMGVKLDSVNATKKWKRVAREFFAEQEGHKARGKGERSDEDDIGEQREYQKKQKERMVSMVQNTQVSPPFQESTSNEILVKHFVVHHEGNDMGNRRDQVEAAEQPHQR